MCHLPKTHLNWNYVRVLPSISNNFPKNKCHSTSKLIKIAFLLTHIIFLYFKLFKQNTRAWTSCARHRQVWKTVQKNSCSNETLFSLLNISAGLKKQQIYVINNFLKKAHVISQNAGNVINKHLKGRESDKGQEKWTPKPVANCEKCVEICGLTSGQFVFFFVKKAVIIIIIVTVVVFIIIIIMNIRQQHHHIITVPSIIPSTAFVSLSAAHKASAALSNLARKDIKITENVVKYLSAEHLILSSVG